MMPLFVVIYLCLFLRLGDDMKVQSFCTALRALSRKDVQYGSHATSEQVYLSSVLYFLEKKKEKKKVHVITNLSRIFCLPFDFPNMVYLMQVIAAGDLCAICQEKMHAPILLRCKHIFCEDCVSEWYVCSPKQHYCLLIVTIRNLCARTQILYHCSLTGLKGKGHVLCAEHWSNRQTSNLLGMGQLVCFSRYSESVEHEAFLYWRCEFLLQAVGPWLSRAYKLMWLSMFMCN